MKPKCGTARKIILIALVGSGCLIRCAPMRGQTADELEKSIANLPPERRGYERFRAWFNSLPPEQQRDGKVDARYRGYLKSRGFSDAEADAQLKLVDQQGARAEVERWNQILTAEKPRFNTKPNAFLMEIAKARAGSEWRRISAIATPASAR